MTAAQHFIIAVERLFAYFAPIRYRARRSVRLGSIVTLGVFVWSQIWGLPLVIIDRLNVKNQRRCLMNMAGQPIYSTISEAVLFFLPIFEAIHHLSYYTVQELHEKEGKSSCRCRGR